MPMNPELDGTDMDLASYGLLLSALKQSQAFLRSSGVLLLGDLVGHNESRDMVRATERMLFKDVLELKKPAYIVFGNNDSPDGNYQTFNAKHGSSYQIAKDNWPNAISGFSPPPFLRKCALEQNQYFPCLKNESPKHGNFSILVGEKLNLVGINTVPMNGDYFFVDQTDAYSNLAWMERALIDAAKHKESVIIAMHIPPAINLYSKNYHLRNKNTQEPTFQLEFERIIRKLQDQSSVNIVAILSGHTHYDELHLLETKKTMIPIILNPGLSTSHGNSPAFKNICFESDAGRWFLKDVSSYVYQTERGKFVQYASVQQDLCKQQNTAHCLAALLSRKGALAKFVMQHYYAHNPNQQRTRDDVFDIDIINRLAD